MRSAKDNPQPENANIAVLRAFEKHELVMIGEMHENKQEYDWCRSLVATPEFADRVDDNIPFEEVQKAWPTPWVWLGLLRL